MPRWITTFLIMAALACALPFVHGSAEPRLDPQQPYQARRSSPVTYDVDYTLVVTPPAGTRTLKVWLPLPPSDVGQEAEAGELTTFPVKVAPSVAAEKVYGNRFAFFRFDRPEGGQMIRHRFRAKVWELRWGIDAEKVSPTATWPASFEPYLRPGRSAAADERIARLAREIAKGGKGPAEGLDAVMGWLHGNMKYNFTRASLTADPLRSLEDRAGNCLDYHGLCAAFGRALKVPTRVTYGLSTFAKNSPSHCKMEAYLAPYGWVSFDVSETQKLVRSIEKDEKLSAAEREKLVEAARGRLRGGFRDNTWLLYTKGTDYDLAPPASGKVSIVRTAHVEADGNPLPDPDPSDPARREFAWMTVLRFVPDREIRYPFADRTTLLPKAGP